MFSLMVVKYKASPKYLPCLIFNHNLGLYSLCLLLLADSQERLVLLLIRENVKSLLAHRRAAQCLLKCPLVNNYCLS